VKIAWFSPFKSTGALELAPRWFSCLYRRSSSAVCPFRFAQKTARTRFASGEPSLHGSQEGMTDGFIVWRDFLLAYLTSGALWGSEKG